MDPIQPQTPGATPKKHIGPIIGVVVLIVLIVIAALYFWGEKISNRNASSSTTQAQSETMLAADEAKPVSTSDEVTDLEAELQGSGSTDVDLSGI